MTPIYAATILLVAFAIGEIINVKTKARISSFLATSVILIALFWMGAPREIMTVTGFATVATTLYGLTMVNMGSMVKVRDMLSQWKTLIIGFCAVCAICLMITTVGPLLIDRRLAICGAPVVAGGTPVYLMVKAANWQIWSRLMPCWRPMQSPNCSSPCPKHSASLSCIWQRLPC